jgi:transposase
MTPKKSETSDGDLPLRKFAEALDVSYWVAYGWVESGKVKGFKKGPFPGKTSRIFVSMSEFKRVKQIMDAKQNEPDS